MANLIETSGSYVSKISGASVAFEYSYTDFNSIEDALEVLGDKALTMLQRMEKVDAGNTARERAKTANGDSTRIAMSEEEKAEKKQERQADKALLVALKNNPELLAQLGL